MTDHTHISDATTKPSAKKHFALMALLVVVVASVAVYANMWKEQRVVGEVVVEGNSILSTRDILTLAKVQSGSAMFDLDLFAIEQRVLKNEFVKSVAVHRDIPNRVRISIVERVPVAAIVTDKLLYIDADAVVLPPTRSSSIFDLPVLSGTVPSTELVVGKQTTNKNVAEALAILATAREVDEDVYRNISEIAIDGGKDVLFYTAEFGIPVILGRGNVGVKLVAFESFWRQVVARNGAQDLQYIDLRFDEQVVVRWNTSVLEKVSNS